MDELTRERYPFVLPRRELVKVAVSPKVIAERRRILNGWDESDEKPDLRQLRKSQRLTAAIRKAS